MRYRSFRRAFLLLAVLAVLAGLAACDASATPTPGPTPTVIPLPTAVQTGQPAPVPTGAAGVRADVSPTATPYPCPPCLPPTPVDFFWLLYLGSGVLFSAVASWLIDRVIAFAANVWPKVPLDETRQRWVSMIVPAVLVLLGWAGLALYGALPLTWEGLQSAVWYALIVLVGKQVVFAAYQSATKPKVP